MITIFENGFFHEKFKLDKVFIQLKLEYIFGTLVRKTLLWTRTEIILALD